MGVITDYAMLFQSHMDSGSEGHYPSMPVCVCTMFWSSQPLFSGKRVVRLEQDYDFYHAEFLYVY